MNAQTATDRVKFLSNIQLEFHFPCNVGECLSQHIRKNRHPTHKQNYICLQCGSQLAGFYDPPGYSQDIKAFCLKMYVNGMGFRGISRVTGVPHTTILNWVKQVSDTYETEDTPQGARAFWNCRLL